MDGTQSLKGRISRLEEKLGQRKKGILVVTILHEPPPDANQTPYVVVLGATEKEEEQVRIKAIERWKTKQKAQGSGDGKAG